MFDAYIPKITLPSGESDIRKGDGIGMIINGKVMLVDAFQGDEATNGLISWLKSNGVTQIDLAVCTHAHGDHWGGFKPIVNAGIKIKEFRCYHIASIRGGNDASREDSDNLLELIRWLQARDTRVLFVDHGSVLNFEDTTWKIYRDQPASAKKNDTNAWEYVNNGSLVLWSPELELLMGGDGPEHIKKAIAHFGAKVSGYDIAHHGNSCTESNAAAVKAAGCVVAWESCVERGGPGTTGWTEFGARRVKQQGIPVWMQNQPIYIEAANGKIVFRQGGKIVTANIPYQSYQTGWNKDAKGWFYTLSDGRRAKGWIKVGWSKPQSKDGKDWFFMDEDGYMVKGFHKCSWSGGISTFYFDENGVMQTGWKHIGGRWYYFDPKTGAMKTGWLYDNGSWFYLGADGKMVTGWVDYKGRRCYLEPVSGKNQGHAYRNQTAVIDGKTWSFDDNCYAHEIKATGNITSVSGKLNDISASRRQFAIDIANYVRKYAPQYGINVYSPIIAQAIHESGWGESKLSAKYHNYFGLKCGTKWTGKSVNLKTQEEYSAGSLTTISANFRAYDSMEEGVKGYFEFIQLARYANLKGITSPRKYLETIITDGYATGSQYVTNTMNLINLYNLTQFDVIAVPIPTPTEPTKTDANPVDVLLSIASAEVGYHEGANNKNKYGDELHKIQPSNMDINAPYCDAYCDWTVLKTCEAFGYGADMAREVLCGDFDDYTYASINLYKKQGRWSSSPARGYQIFFGGSGHTGWVESVDSQIHTIEGNKSDQVMRCTYALNDSRIIGYGMPKYELLSGGLTAENMPLIKKGATGFAVVELQKRLNAASYEGKTILTVDGDFGTKTYNALKAYQKDRGLEVDGECGKNSWQSLFNEV